MPGAQGKTKQGSYCLVDTVLVRKNEKFLEMDGGDGHTKRICVMSLNRHLKTVEKVNFMLCISYHRKKKNRE